MRITTLLGSPRRAGNTAHILAAFEQRASRAHEVCRINVVDEHIEGCRGCDACQEVLDAPGCRRRDDAEAVFARILASDAVVYATPVYVWDFTAQMKALMDRHYCLVKWRGREQPKHLLRDKKTMLLATCGGDARSNADLLEEIFRREMRYLRCRVVGTYVVPWCALPAELGEQPAVVAERMLGDLEGSSGPRRA
ncbi:MAG TPA: flavodoxin family protein [Vicinamibacteria bacterium]|nr:flavodoxin family protein [Vicinamibacteria bacterium]